MIVNLAARAPGFRLRCTTERASMTGGLVLLCGRSFSGKSTVASSRAGSLPGSVVSLDAINEERGLYGGEGIPLSEWAWTNELAKERVLARLHDDETVIVDDTRSPRFLRDGGRALCSSAGAPMVLVFVDTPAEVIQQRHLANRATGHRGDVTDEVMAAHQESFEPPEADEQAIRLQVDPSPRNLDVLCAFVGESLGQDR
jgi:predicted kinase